MQIFFEWLFSFARAFFCSQLGLKIPSQRVFSGTGCVLVEDSLYDYFGLTYMEHRSSINF